MSYKKSPEMIRAFVLFIEEIKHFSLIRRESPLITCL